MVCETTPRKAFLDVKARREVSVTSSRSRPSDQETGSHEHGFSSNRVGVHSTCRARPHSSRAGQVESEKRNNILSHPVLDG